MYIAKKLLATHSTDSIGYYLYLHANPISAGLLHPYMYNETSKSTRFNPYFAAIIIGNTN